MMRLILGWLTSGPLDRLMASVDRSIDNGTERERVRSEALAAYVRAQAQIAGSRQWFFPLLFLVPAGFWFGSVCVYSVLWCRNCAYPQDWTIAALPAPLDEWMGLVVASLFVGRAGEAIIGRLRK